MQTAAIRTVANSLPQNKVILLTILISNRYIPYTDLKKIVGAPKDYEFTCLLTIGYPAENAFLPKQKVINVEERIHRDMW